MFKIIKIAVRNLFRQKKRSALTIGIVAFGILAVILFTATAGSFKSIVVGQITDSMLGHIQIHKKGYIQSLDNLPLDKTINPGQIKKLKEILDSFKEIESYSFRILAGGMLSNYKDSTNIKLSAFIPAKEKKTVPLLEDRVIKGKFLKKGEILIPDLIAKGFKVKVGESVALVLTNADGSVNGQSLKISGIMESVVGPTGKYGYIHIDDARTILRMPGTTVSEVAIRIKDFDKLNTTLKKIKKKISKIKNKNGKPVFEIHTWEKLSPFYNIARMVDMMALFIRIILIGIVLISIMNVMIMAVYERVKEIGSLSAMGTMPSTIRLIFILEGFFLGVFGSVVGAVVSIITVVLVNLSNFSVKFGRGADILLRPEVSVSQMLITITIVVAVSMLAVLWPAMRASKMEPVEALR